MRSGGQIISKVLFYLIGICAYAVSAKEEAKKEQQDQEVYYGLFKRECFERGEHLVARECLEFTLL